MKIWFHPTEKEVQNKRKELLSVAAIENGTVIDHITAGKGTLLLNVLKLNKHKNQMSIGLNLPSAGMKTKDLIKVSNWELTSEDSAKVAVFSPTATINIIQDYRVVNKFQVTLPESLPHLLICPNPRCITHSEVTSRLFHIKDERGEVRLNCHFCEKSFSHGDIAKYNL
jgi:aspartate carbamoyltransferase regulatory subunit